MGHKAICTNNEADGILGVQTKDAPETGFHSRVSFALTSISDSSQCFLGSAAVEQEFSSHFGL